MKLTSKGNEVRSNSDALSKFIYQSDRFIFLPLRTDIKDRVFVSSKILNKTDIS